MEIDPNAAGLPNLNIEMGVENITNCISYFVQT